MSDAPQTLTLVIPLSVKRRSGRKTMIAPGVMALERPQDITLIKAVARALPVAEDAGDVPLRHDH
jgi:hypothetical protein